MMAEEKRKLSIRLDLEDELLQKFQYLQKRYGGLDGVNTLKLIISLEYERKKREELT